MTDETEELTELIVSLGELKAQVKALVSERDTLRQQLHDARDEALEEAAATCAAISKAYWVNWRGTADKYDIGACDGAAECAEDIRALKGAKQ